MRVMHTKRYFLSVLVLLIEFSFQLPEFVDNKLIAEPHSAILSVEKIWPITSQEIGFGSRTR